MPGSSSPRAVSGRWTGVLLPLLLLVMLDVTFNLYFWRIPKLTSPWSDFGYEFLRSVHLLEQSHPAGARVIAFGSSVIGSFNPIQVQGLLNAADPSMKVEAHRLLLPGIKPSDSRLFFEAELNRLRPDVVLMNVNVADFLNPSFEQDLKQQVRYVLPPWGALRERYAYMQFNNRIDLALATISNLYHYRRAIRSCLQDHAKLALRWLRQRPVRRAYGIYADGYTRQFFGLPLDGRSNLDFEYYIDPAWLRQYGQVTLNFSSGDDLLAHRVETEPGWKTVDLQRPGRGAWFLQVAADSIWSARAAGVAKDARPLGIRLRQPPANAVNSGQSPPFEYPPAFPQRTFLRMGDALGQEYVERWEHMLGGGSADGRRFRGYEEAEIDASRRAFPVTQEYAALEQMVAGLSHHGVAVVLINSPESPLLLKRYQATPYYQGHLRFLGGLADKYPGVHFYDLAAALPVEDFNDWHHVNYVGAIKLGERYAEFVREAVADSRRVQRAAVQE
jgi:hypothetical protein